MTEGASPRRALRHLLVEAFAVANLAFLGFDVALAHWSNDFAHPAEWAPVGFSAVATLLLLPGLARRRYYRGVQRWIGMLVGGASIAVGITGMFLHLEFGQPASPQLVPRLPQHAGGIAGRGEKAQGIAGR